MTVVRTVWGRLAGGERGYSLIELVITMAVLGIVLGALTTVFVSGSKAELDMNRRFQAQQDARTAFGALRTDLHAASCATPQVVSGNSQLLIYTSQSYTSPSTAPASRGDCTTGDQGGTGTPVTVWCAYPVTPWQTARWTLYRIATSACPATAAAALTAGGKFESDYLSNGGALFADPGATSGQHQGITATLSATLGTSIHADTYTLQDTIILRNSPRT